MANQRGTFAKRQREMELKDKAKAKEARRAEKRTEQRTTKGPQIAWDEAVRAVVDDEASPPLATGTIPGAPIPAAAAAAAADDDSD